MPTFDPTGRYRLSPRVGLRPEPFGALAYHYDTRRLVFLKAAELVDLVRTLHEYPSATAAVRALVDDESRRGAFLAGLSSLAAAGVVDPSPQPALQETA